MTNASTTMMRAEPQTPQRERFISTALWVASVEAVLAVFLRAPLRTLSAYAVAFSFLLTLGLGSLFFVLLHHLVQARWSTFFCFQMERVARLLVWAPIFSLPFLLLHGAHAVLATGIEPACGIALDNLFQSKHRWLLLRSAIYLGGFAALAQWFRYPTRTAQLEKKLRSMHRWAGPCMVLFGLSTIFASFDFWMSLEHGFHSAVYGVYIFTGATVSALSLLTLISTFHKPTNERDLRAFNRSRFDLSKLLFGFVALWGYIAFSQFLIIDYAGLPNEAAFYSTRTTHEWTYATTALVSLRLVLPILLLMPRTLKRSPAALRIASLLLIVGHFVDMAWLILPAVALGPPRFGAPEIVSAFFTIATLWLIVRRLRLPARTLSDMLSTNRESSVDLIYTEAPPHPATVPIFAMTSIESPPASLVDTAHAIPLAPASASRSTLAIPVLLILFAAITSGFASAAHFTSGLRVELEQKNRTLGLPALVAVRKDAEKEQSEYRWIDAEKGILQIPMERAQELLLIEANSHRKNPTLPHGATSEAQQ